MKQNSVETGVINAAAASWVPPTTTFASPPSSPVTGSVYIFTDALSAGATVGGGSSLSICRWSGSVWQALSAPSGAGSGALTLLEQHTASSSATLNFTTWLSSAFDTYMIELVGLVPATTDTVGQFRMSTNGGSSYDSGLNYSWVNEQTVAGGNGFGGANSGATSISLNTAVSNAVAGHTLCGTFKLYLIPSAFTQMVGQTLNRLNDGRIFLNDHVGQYQSTTAVNAFRFLFSTGNITSGSIRVYGIAK